MQALPIHSVRSWTSVSNGFTIPSCIDLDCPHCGKSVSVNPINSQIDGARHLISLSGICPRCREEMYFFTFFRPPLTSGTQPHAIYLHPENSRQRKPIDLSNISNDRLKASYEDIIKTFNAGIYSAAATCCRRTLEGVLRDRGTGEQHKNLADAIRDLSKKADLAAPIVEISDLLRMGGNLGAHFSDDGDPTPEVAQSMIDMVEFLLEYLYEVPGRIHSLKSRLTLPSQEVDVP